MVKGWEIGGNLDEYDGDALLARRKGERENEKGLFCEYFNRVLTNDADDLWLVVCAEC